MLRPAAQSVEDVAHVGLVARADEVRDVIDDDDRRSLSYEVLLDIVEDASAVERSGGIVRVKGLYDERCIARAVVVLVGAITRLELVGGILKVEVECLETSLAEFVGNLHSEYGLAYVWFAKQTRHLALIPETMPQVDWRQ